MASKFKYAILDIAKDLKVVILPSRECLMHHNRITNIFNCHASLHHPEAFYYKIYVHL